MAAPVAVTGLGLVTPAGIGVEENWRRVLAGTSTASPDPSLVELPVTISCRVPDFDADALLGRRRVWRYDRFVQLALVALREALADARLDASTWDGTRVAVVVGTALGGTHTSERQTRVLIEEGPAQVSPMLIPMAAVNMLSGYLAMECQALGPNLVTSTACASGTTAIGLARDLLRTGAADVVVTGGSESSLSPTVMAGFAKMGALSRRAGDPAAACRPFDVGRDGFVAAEGAGILVLERGDDARARAAPVRAWLGGYGASADAYHATSPAPEGVGAERAIRAALADADLSPEDVQHVNAHGTGTQLNDLTEAAVLARTTPLATVTSTKGVTGHALGAAGAIEAAYTVLTVQHGVQPPTANLDSQDPKIDLDVIRGAPRAGPVRVALSESFGFGGQNAVLVITAASYPDRRANPPAPTPDSSPRHPTRPAPTPDP
jgi:3-oxoacyl-[acyl-carrier-protein] synthase II